jgi:uncharacterized protein YndB with AHSA1/START domain
MKLDVEYEELLPHPVQAVWSELTNAAAITDWLMMATTDFKPAVGCRFRLKTDRLSTTGWIEAEVLELDAPRRMVWAWSVSDGNPPSLVSFDLVEEGTATRLRLRHVGEFDDQVAEILRGGWPGRMQAIDDNIRRAVGDV